MKSIIISLFTLALMSIMLGGCTPSLSSDNYTTASVGGVNHVIKGTIASARIVQISDDNNANSGGKTGTIAGAVAGGVAGSAIGGDSRTSALGAVGGAVAGGILGNMAQKRLTRQQGIEYVINTSTGMISVVQGLQPQFQRGQHVLVEYPGDRPEGGRARVIADPDFS